MLLKLQEKPFIPNYLEVSIDGATDAIINITTSASVTLFEIEEALKEIRNATDSDLNVIYGHTVNIDLDDEMIITIIATGYELHCQRKYD